MRLRAIRNLYPSALTTNNNEKEVFGKDGKQIVLDENLINTEIARLKTLPPPKEEQLSNLIIAVSTGKRFYADPDSRTDLTAAIIEAQSQNATEDSEISWKTADGWKNVTLSELKEANKKALEAKAQIIGAS